LDADLNVFLKKFKLHLYFSASILGVASRFY